MAHYEYTKTYPFFASAKIPFRYVCSTCGKEVTGWAEITEKKEVKVTSMHREKLSISEQAARNSHQDAVSALRARIHAKRRAVASGTYDMLNKHLKCPHCGAEQHWGYRKGKAVVFSLLTLLAIAAAITCVILYIRQLRKGDGDLSWMGGALFFLIWIVAFGLVAFQEIRGLRDTRGQAGGKPEVFFDQMVSTCLNELK